MRIEEKKSQSQALIFSIITTIILALGALASLTEINLSRLSTNNCIIENSILVEELLITSQYDIKPILRAIDYENKGNVLNCDFKKSFIKLNKSKKEESIKYYKMSIAILDSLVSIEEGNIERITLINKELQNAKKELEDKKPGVNGTERKGVDTPYKKILAQIENYQSELNLMLDSLGDRYKLIDKYKTYIRKLQEKINRL